MMFASGKWVPLAGRSVHFVAGNAGNLHESDDIEGFSASVTMATLSPRPRVFIGSSTEGLKIAKAIQAQVARGDHCTVTIWTQGVFGMMRSAFEALLRSLTTYDFAILVLTPDDEIVSRAHGYKTPRDNVVFELGLFLGSLGRDRTFIVCDPTKLKLPSDLDSVTLAPIRSFDGSAQPRSISKAAALIRASILQHGARHGDFALCIPSHHAESEGFNYELKHHLTDELAQRGIKMVDACPLIGKPDAETLVGFRRKIQQLVDNGSAPRYLLLIWPLLEARQDKSVVLKNLRRLAKDGSRIAFINEFPTIKQSDRRLFANTVFIRVNVAAAIDLLCCYIRDHLAPQNEILLVHANQKFRVAKERKDLYQRKLKAMRFKTHSIPIPSWEEEDARVAVLRKLRKSKLKNRYDVIVAANDKMADGAEAALFQYWAENNIGKSERTTWVIGFDGLSSTIEKVKDPDSRIAATIAANPRMYAETAFRELCQDRFSKGGRPVLIEVTRDDLKAKNLPPRR